jgi:hypothetical protein
VPVVAPLPMLFTEIVNVPFAPAVKLPRWLFVMDRSGARTTVAVDDLSAASVSPGSDTVAVLLMLPDALLFIVTINVMFPAVAPGAMGPEFVQVTVCAGGGVHDQSKAALPVIVIGAGTESVTVMVPVVAAFPTFFTAIV